MKISKSSSLIEYDDNNTSWDADIVFDIANKSIDIIGTTRVLSDKERDNIITEILNKFAFGNYFNYEPYIWKCKLKNRGMEKNEELNSKCRSYTIIGEEVLLYPKREDDCDMVKALRNLFTNLKNEAKEYKIRLKRHSNKKEQSISFDFYGKKNEYKLFKEILNEIKWEYEKELSKIIKHKIRLEVFNGKYKDSKATSIFIIKEAN